MHISFTVPLERAWNRMKATLFSPFDAAKWAVLGFTAWVAGILDREGSKGAGGDYDWSDGVGLEGAAEGAASVIRSIQTGAMILPLVVLALLAGVVIYVILLWLSSRFRFIFLDNVIHDRARVSDPWTRLDTLGDSLFRWRLGFTILVVLVVFALVLPFFIGLGLDAIVGTDGAFTVTAVLMMVLGGILVGIPVAYVNLLLGDFVVPIMYREGIPATAAWARFMPLLREHAVHFVLYGLFILILHLGVVLVAIGVTLATCCMGGILLALPYVGTVVLLPVWVTYRVYSLEFLAQLYPGPGFLDDAAGPAA